MAERLAVRLDAEERTDERRLHDQDQRAFIGLQFANINTCILMKSALHVIGLYYVHICKSKSRLHQTKSELHVLGKSLQTIINEY